MSSNKVPPRSGNPKSNQFKPGDRLVGENRTGSPASKPNASTTVRSRRNAPPPPPTNNTLAIIVTAMILLAVVVFISLIVLNGSKSNVTPTAAPAAVVTGSGDVPTGVDPTAQVQTLPTQGQQHITGKGTDYLNGPYNSNPPTSGPHLAYASPWGIFNQPIQDELQIHNLEHGGVVIQYDCPQGCPTTINSLSAYALKYPPTNFTGVLLAPRPNLPNGARIAVTAWTHLLLLKTVDQDKIQQFLASYLGKGPEGDPSFRP